MRRTKFLIVTVIGVLGIAAVTASLVTWDGEGRGYPVRPITVVVPFPAGGPSDVVAGRALAAQPSGSTLSARPAFNAWGSKTDAGVAFGRGHGGHPPPLRHGRRRPGGAISVA
jgi:hypothetical protein